jgi:hypothetical protein
VNIHLNQLFVFDAPSLQSKTEVVNEIANSIASVNEL